MQNSFIIANLISSRLCIFQHLHRDSENRKKRNREFLVILVPVLTLLALLHNFPQIGFQVLDILFVLCPLLLGQNGLGHRQVQGTHDAIVALVVQLARKATNGLNHICVLMETIVTVQTYRILISIHVCQVFNLVYLLLTVLIESGQVVGPLAEAGWNWD